MRIPAQLQAKLSPVLASNEWSVIQEYLTYHLDYINVRLRSADNSLMYRYQGEAQLLAELLKLKDKIINEIQEREVEHAS